MSLVAMFCSQLKALLDQGRQSAVRWNTLGEPPKEPTLLSDRTRAQLDREEMRQQTSSPEQTKGKNNHFIPNRQPSLE